MDLYQQRVEQKARGDKKRGRVVCRHAKTVSRRRAGLPRTRTNAHQHMLKHADMLIAGSCAEPRIYYIYHTTKLFVFRRGDTAPYILLPTCLSAHIKIYIKYITKCKSYGTGKKFNILFIAIPH